ncbi:Aip5p Ecym_1278 [Eremothecium cymbalariae DBVPG|uniref:Glutaredoxin domain-containing protein n=1 Tax=Eremothecium cymbalariae (strain CBS 270.75 / DBVPG 7215 / KCTC 17166 / NRRL Y-17582) TaxID=931890 RepID=G8JN55_ERECY|nr:hypothetical protein Ecym_1278 [Eremothecium cymbalariae DBVPG\
MRGIPEGTDDRLSNPPSEMDERMPEVNQTIKETTAPATQDAVVACSDDSCEAAAQQKEIDLDGNGSQQQVVGHKEMDLIKEPSSQQEVADEDEDLPDEESRSSVVSRAMAVPAGSETTLTSALEDRTAPIEVTTALAVETPLENQRTSPPPSSEVTAAQQNAEQTRVPKDAKEACSTAAEKETENTVDNTAKAHHSTPAPPSPKLRVAKQNPPAPRKEHRTDITQDIDDFLKELSLNDTTANDIISQLNNEENKDIKDKPIYLITSLAGGGFHMPSRTNRLATILTANQIVFQYRDCGSDDDARHWWKKQAKGRTLPAIMVGNSIVGNWQEIEEANEEWRVRGICGLE